MRGRAVDTILQSVVSMQVKVCLTNARASYKPADLRGQQIALHRRTCPPTVC